MGSGHSVGHSRRGPEDLKFDGLVSNQIAEQDSSLGVNLEQVGHHVNQAKEEYATLMVDVEHIDHRVEVSGQQEKYLQSWKPHRRTLWKPKESPQGVEPIAPATVAVMGFEDYCTKFKLDMKEEWGGLDIGCRHGLGQLNKLRSHFPGFGTYKYSPELRSGGLEHCNYYLATGQTGHHENPSLDEYTQTGDLAARCSGLAYSGRNAADCLTSLLAGPFHRKALLKPGARLIGVCFEKRGDRQIGMFPGIKCSPEEGDPPRFTLFPPPGYDMVCGTFEGENPDPRPHGFRFAQGLIVSIGLNRTRDLKRFEYMVVNSFLDKTTKKQVPHWLLQPNRRLPRISEEEWKRLYAQSRPKRRTHFEILKSCWIGALQPLENGHDFHLDVTIKFKGSVLPVALQWDFSTRPVVCWEVSCQDDLDTACELSQAGDSVLFHNSGWFKLPTDFNCNFCTISTAPDVGVVVVGWDTVKILESVQFSGLCISFNGHGEYSLYSSNTKSNISFVNCTFSCLHVVPDHQLMIIHEGNLSLENCIFTECPGAVIWFDGTTFSFNGCEFNTHFCATNSLGQIENLSKLAVTGFSKYPSVAQPFLVETLFRRKEN